MNDEPFKAENRILGEVHFDEDIYSRKDEDEPKFYSKILKSSCDNCAFFGTAKN